MNIVRVLVTFVEICRLRQGPQDLPTSSSLLSLSLFLYTLSSVAFSLIEIPLQRALLSSVLDVTLLVSIIGSLLYLVHYTTRFTQTITALAGTGFLFSVASNPLFYWLKQAQIQNVSIDLPIFLLLIVMSWNLAVYAHILRHTLEVKFMMALLITMIASFLASTILLTVFPTPS